MKGSSFCTLNDVCNGNNGVADRFGQSGGDCNEKGNVLSRNDQTKSDLCPEREALKSRTLDPNCTDCDSVQSHIYSLTNEQNVNMDKQFHINDLPGYISPRRAAGDDDDSVSTLGSNEGDAGSYSSGTSRSIFRDYWDTGSDEKGMSPASRHSLSTPDQESSSSQHHSVAPRRISLDWSSYHQDYEGALTDEAAFDPYGYEDYLKINEEGRTVIPSAALLNVAKNKSADHFITRNPLASPTDPNPISHSSTVLRRKIFAHKYMSKNATLPSYEYKSKPTPTKQPSTLHNRRLRSSLRDRSSSISESLPTVGDSILSESTRLSVTFDTHVSIHEYSKRCESYIHDGWSKFFY